MPIHVYMSEISQVWPLERQLDTLHDVLPEAAVFTDILGFEQRRARRSDDLIKRTCLLQSAAKSSTGVVYVASLAVLAWSETDLLTVVMTLRKNDIDLVSMSEAIEDGEVAAWRRSLVTSGLEDAQLSGVSASGIRRMSVSVAINQMVRPYWHLKSPSIGALCEAAGLTTGTVIARLGSRSRAQWQYESAQANHSAGGGHSSGEKASLWEVCYLRSRSAFSIQPCSGQPPQNHPFFDTKQDAYCWLTEHAYGRAGNDPDIWRLEA